VDLEVKVEMATGAVQSQESRVINSAIIARRTLIIL
jgi:hypothetical protein